MKIVMGYSLKTLFLSGMTFLLGSMVCPGLLFAGVDYQPGRGGKVENASELAGKMVFKGKVPPPRPFGLIVYPDIELCKRISDGQGHRLIRDFTVSPAGGFKNVVISIEGVSLGKPFASGDSEFSIKNCKFDRIRSVIRDGQMMTFKNLDPVLHDIQTYAIKEKKRGKRIFDRPALPKTTMSTQVKLPTKKEDVIWVQCGKHSFMQSWSYVVENPYFAISDSEGRFNIADIPPGRYKVTAWHPFMKRQELWVDFAPGQKVDLEFVFGSKAASPGTGPSK